MKPVFQTRINNKNGNCFSAALASIFEVSLEDVPDSGLRDDDSWFDPIEKWLAERNLRLLPVDVEASVDDFKPVGIHIITGESGSFSNTLHSVVGKDGKVIHDPNPESKSPLKKIKFYEFFQVIDPLGTHPR